MKKKMFFDVPSDAVMYRCPGCLAMTYWVHTTHGRHLQVDEDGSPHFMKCLKEQGVRDG